MQNVNNNDTIAAIIAGFIAFILSFIFKTYDYLDKLKDEVKQDKQNINKKENWGILIKLWTLEGIIKGFVGALIFFGVLHFVPNINLVLNYILSGVVAQNGIMILDQIRMKTKEKIERL